MSSHVVEDVKLRAKSQVLSDVFSMKRVNCTFTINGKTGWLGGQLVGLVCLALGQYFTVLREKLLNLSSEHCHPLPTVSSSQTTNKFASIKVAFIIIYYASIHYESDETGICLIS